MRVKALREKRLKLINDIRATYAKEDDDKYVWTTEDSEAISQMEAELATTEEALARAEKDEAYAKRLNDLEKNDRRQARDRLGREDFDHRNDPDDEDDDDEAPTYRDRALALQAWFRSGAGSRLTREQRTACQRLDFNPTAQRIDIHLGDDGFLHDIQNEYRENSPRMARQQAQRLCRERIKSEREQRAMSAFDGPTGGYMVPAEFLNRFEENMLWYSGVMQVAEIIRTSSGAELHWPSADDTSNEGEFIGESNSIDGSTEPAIKNDTWYSFKCHAKMIKVPYELIEDNAFNLVGRIGGWLGQRLGRIKERKFTLGTGVKQPRGFTLDSKLGVTAAATNEITFDEVIDLISVLDPSHEGNARFMCHRLITAHLRKKKDGQGQYLWEPSVKVGTPDLILGRPVTYNSFLPSSITTGTKTLYYGDFSNYKVREVGSLRLVRLNERYADLDQVAFDALQRVDGKLLDVGTAPIKHLIQA